MTEKEKMLAGELYDACDAELLADLNHVKVLCQQYNNLLPTDFAARNTMLIEMLGQADKDTFINQPFYCDYGKHIRVGRHFFANFGLTVLDEAFVTIGDNCFVGPNVNIYTACHSTDPVERATRKEWAEPVTIGNNVWLGGNVTILPGVTIGDNCTIGAGSVVTRDIPANSIAAGNPAKVINKLTAKQAKRVEVVAAVIFDAEGRIFATQRGYGEWKDWWEFPGGKIEAGESRETALKREIREELDAEIEVEELIKTVDYDYPNFHLTMHCYKCRLAATGYRLREHEAAKWLAPKDLQSVQWLPADEEFIAELAQDPIRIVFEEADQQSAAYDGDKMIGECQYNVDRTGKWVIMHTGVRPEYNGRGIAKRLVEKVIEAARDRSAKIIPVCSYAQRMMSDKDEYKDVLE